MTTPRTAWLFSPQTVRTTLPYIETVLVSAMVAETVLVSAMVAPKLMTN